MEGVIDIDVEYKYNAEIARFNTLKEAKAFIKACKRFDEENGDPFDEQYRIVKEWLENDR